VTSIRRWLIFNAVGALGFLVQLAALRLLIETWGLGYLAATAIAVEAAVIHNFIWHEHWTWADRGNPGRAGAARRFLRFHLTNGAFSIAGNLVCMRIFMSTLPVNYLVANVLAIAVCSIVNYVLSDRLVFQPAVQKRGTTRISSREEEL